MYLKNTVLVVIDSTFETNMAGYGAVLYTDISGGGSITVKSSKIETQTILGNAQNGSLIYVLNHAEELREFKIVDSLISHDAGVAGRVQVLNHGEYTRSYSSVWGNVPIGTELARSRLKFPHFMVSR